ncbi:ABC transporter ATP-binding protein [Ralstonia pickettii]|nr:ABC transporter ATP-binding protein [Ralstonia pickettii]
MLNILEANQVTKMYNNLSVVKQTSFSIKKGAIYVIQGKSGSGKSTFLSMMGGMEKPSTGSVYFKNQSIYELNDEQQSAIRGQSFGFVFQSFHLIPELTVEENIQLPLRFTKTTPKWNIQELTAKLNLPPTILVKRPGFLSGGEQQRVAIARALITSPEIIFADEPTGNLDAKTSAIIVDVLTQLCMTQGTSLIVVTHEKNLIRQPHYLYSMESGVLKLRSENV